MAITTVGKGAQVLTRRSLSKSILRAVIPSWMALMLGMVFQPNAAAQPIVVAQAIYAQGTAQDNKSAVPAVENGRAHHSSLWTSAPLIFSYAILGLLGLLLALRSAGIQRQEHRRHLQQLRERESRLKVAIWGSGDEFWDWDLRTGQLIRLGADQQLGVPYEHRLTTEEWKYKSVHPADMPEVERIAAEHLSGKRQFFESTHRVKDPAGGWVWMLSRGKIVERDGAGKPIRVAGTARNITLRREVEEERRIAQKAIQSLSEAVTVATLNYCMVSVNPAFCQMTGYSEDEVLGKNTSSFDCDRHDKQFYENLRLTLERKGTWAGEIWQSRRNGSLLLSWMEIQEVRDDLDQRTHWVAVFTDITERKRVERELRYLANYDPLTGLPNRTMLGERLAHALIEARRNDKRVAVLFLDLDRFKHVNDSMGHAVGDRLLKSAANRIQSALPEKTTVARLGGDEFTIVLESLVELEEAEYFAGKLIEAFSRPLEVDGRHEVVISPSIGIAVYPDHGQVPTDLLKFADTAMYQAKEQGRNTYQLYTEAMDAKARQRAVTITQLQKALQRGEFSLVYQPKVMVNSGRVSGVEALLRWNNHVLGPIEPNIFIPLAEETGLIVEIGEYVLFEACSQLREWHKMGIRDLSMAINVSVLQLFRGNLIESLKALLEEFDLPPNSLDLELTESMVMANPEHSIRVLNEVRALGIQLSIDDFGTGHSSLAYLKRLPIDNIKIDQTFVGDLTTDPDDEAITATIIMMAHSLGLNVVAEGVETAEQLEYLREKRCDEAQGHHFSPPLKSDACYAFIAARKSKPPEITSDSGEE